MRSASFDSRSLTLALAQDGGFAQDGGRMQGQARRLSEPERSDGESKGALRAAQPSRSPSSLITRKRSAAATPGDRAAMG